MISRLYCVADVIAGVLHTTVDVSMKVESVEKCASSKRHFKTSLSKKPTPFTVTKVEPSRGPRLGVKEFRTGAV